MIDFNERALGDNEEILVLELFGQLDTMHCDYLYSVLEHRIEEGSKKMILDCDELSFISSMGLGMLMRAHARMKKQGGDVNLARVRGAVADVLHLVRMDKVLRLYPSVDEAAAAFEA